MLQRCVALKSSFRIVSSNIIFTRSFSTGECRSGGKKFSNVRGFIISDSHFVVVPAQEFQGPQKTDISFH